MRDGPFLLIDCKQIDASPHTDSSSQVTCNHSIASWAELDQHNGIRMRLSLFLRCLGILIPDGNPS